MQRLLILIFFISSIANAQNNELFKRNVDSLKKELAKAKRDSAKLNLYIQIIGFYAYTVPDSAVSYVQQEISFAKQIKSDSTLASALAVYGAVLNLSGNYPEAINYGLQALKIAERLRNPLVLAFVYDWLGATYNAAGDYNRAIFYCLKAKSTFERSIPASAYKNRDTADRYLGLMIDIPLIYDKFNKIDSALKYIKIVDDFYIKTYGSRKWPPLFYLFGNYYFKKKQYVSALQYYREGIANSGPNTNMMDNYNGVAKVLWKQNKTDSAVYYSKKVIEDSKLQKYPIAQLEALNMLAEVYKSRYNPDSLAKYLSLILAVKDSLYNQQKVMQLQSMTFNEQLRQQDIIAQQKQFKTKIRTLILTAGLIVLLIVTCIMFLANRNKQKAYSLLQKQKVKTENALEKLKSTQALLIQNEKMASLGELTAGIAHEIQNPLNFVNNFSEVSSDLVDEIEVALQKDDKGEAIAIASDIKENLQKINHHGRRADAIVKGMLQHSRASTGKKEPTGINALADEYLRLSYHGFRAKDKSFNATIEKHLDESIGKINIVPQDIGRVLLNLFNNAFYAVTERRKTSAEGYEPTVSVSTKTENDKVIITVGDNGIGVPKKVVDKIFQPFFTTKPTGQGTGLGLSLGYDIIKAHGGDISVDTKEGEGSEFIIHLPN